MLSEIEKNELIKYIDKMEEEERIKFINIMIFRFFKFEDYMNQLRETYQKYLSEKISKWEKNE